MITRLKYTLFLTFIGLFSITYSHAQEDINYVRQRVKEREIVPYPHIREADVMFNRKVCRVIDTREKQNKPLDWARNPLKKILYSAVTTNYGGKTLKAYKSDSLIDSKYGIYDLEELLERGAETETIEIDDGTGWITDTTITTELDPNEIYRFKICEEWIFDKQRSMFFSRMYAMAPLYSTMKGGKEFEMDLFWVKYEDFRKILINEPIFNPHNDGQRLTFDDFFELRLFSSYAVYESNVYDREISEFAEFADPFNAILESEEVKKRLFDYEHDLWEW
jgi:gliding motility associated protien GldN